MTWAAAFFNFLALVGLGNGTMELHFASVWEAVSDIVPNRPALICGNTTRTWREYDDRAARIAALLDAHGIGHDSKVGIYLHNSNEYLEAQYGIFKARGVPVNVNYRYKAGELVYLLDNADAEALFFQACYAARIWEIRKQLPKVKLYVQVDDGTESLLADAVDYERSIRDHAPMERIERRSDETYMLYTGGTTGMPKGVMYQHRQFISAMMGAVASLGLEVPSRVEDIPAVIEATQAAEGLPVSLTACPLMHGTGMWLGSIMPHLTGGTVVTVSKLGLDPHLIWSEVERNRCTSVTIVGDAFAKPMLDALDDAAKRGNPYDLSSLDRIVSSGVMWSAEIKEGLLAHHDMRLVDAMGSTEGGIGSSIATRAEHTQTARFQINPGVKVITDDGREVVPGSGEMGKLATSGLVPMGYYKDPEKSAATFKEIDGVRYSFPGDYATVEEDGAITLLGRGSNCINTAGEKVYPEEVEEAVKRHPSIYDCLVVGLTDERFGQRVVAVASIEEREAVDEQGLIDFTRDHLAGYKLPKQVLFVEEVRRAPNGKADYKWARNQAERAFG